ncbi:MAG: hypothetical protein GF329_04255 [Candidatus Lokiarchaeota archaeon]|nr:hypothetical protein [Candidatus Lokiarchaeota archaeon]
MKVVKISKKALYLLSIVILINILGLFALNFYNKRDISDPYLITGVPINNSADVDPTKNETVAASTLLGDFASQIIYGESGHVESVMPGGVCPAHYEVKPSDYDLVDSADIIFSHGMEAGFWLNDLLTGAGNTEAEVKVGPMVGGIPWGPPANAIHYVNNMTDVLNNTYNQTANQTKFRQNADNFIANIQSNKTYLEGLASTYGFDGIKVVCMMHQRAFLEWLGFEVVGEWTKSDEQMSVSEVNILIQNATTYGAQLIVSNLQSGTDVGAQVASESNAIHVILCNFPGGVPNTPTYIDQIHYNVEQLKYGKDLFALYQEILSDITAERNLYQILSFVFIGISVVAIVVVVFQQIRIKKTA